MNLKALSEFITIVVASFKALRGFIFKVEKQDALKHTETTDGDTSKEEDLLKRGPR